jgi:hypothetical protein
MMDEIRQREIFRHVALAMMVGSILFGFIRLMGWIRV